MRCRKAVLLAGAMVLLAAAGRTQYLEPREYENPEYRIASAGVFWRDFAPRGSNPAPDSVAIRYNRVMPFVGFRQGLVDIVFGYTTFSQHDVSRTAIFVGTTISSELPLAGGRSSALLLPLLIGADYTKAEAGGPERQSFNIASVGLGTGLKYRLVTRAVDASLLAAAIAHYAIEGLSTGTGFSGVVTVEAGAVFRTIGIGEGLALGYRFRLQTWSMSDPVFNYRAVSHGPYLGVAF
jgi:hypothetical protein